MTPASEWARCREWIRAAVDSSPGFETIEDVEAKIEAGAYQFWPALSSAAITELQVFPTERVLMVLYGGGNLIELMEKMEPEFCTFARFLNCSAIGGIGRRGWDRVARKHGYEFATIMMVKRLG